MKLLAKDTSVLSLGSSLELGEQPTSTFFFLITAEVIHPFEVYTRQWFLAYSELCNHHHCLIPEHFYRLKKETHAYLQSSPPKHAPPTPQPQATTNAISITTY